MLNGEFEYQTDFLSQYPVKLGVVACICNPATLEAEFRNVVGSILVWRNSPSIGAWIVSPPVIHH